MLKIVPALDITYFLAALHSIQQLPMLQHFHASKLVARIANHLPESVHKLFLLLLFLVSFVGGLTTDLVHRLPLVELLT